MSRIRGKNTKLEMKIRRALHRECLRYRVHPEGIYGKPDLYFVRQRAVVFIHGCFWHRHSCRLFREPDERSSFWAPKLLRNHSRDVAVRKTLLEGGYRHLEIWECSVRGAGKLDHDVLAQEVRTWLNSSAPTGEIRGFKA